MMCSPAAPACHFHLCLFTDLPKVCTLCIKLSTSCNTTTVVNTTLFRTLHSVTHVWGLRYLFFPLASFKFTLFQECRLMIKCAVNISQEFEGSKTEKDQTTRKYNFFQLPLQVLGQTLKDKEDVKMITFRETRAQRPKPDLRFTSK